MSFGTMLLIITAILVYCGLLQRVLDRMYITDKQALWLIAAMLIGTFLPDISVGIITLNLGGAIIPLAVCGYLLYKANESWERWRSVFGAIVTGAAVYSLSVFLPSEPEALLVDPLWLYGACGGVVAWLIGRSRRCAFVCGVTGILLADIVIGVIAIINGYQLTIKLGMGGIADASVISGAISVLLCEIIGEAIERMARLSQGGNPS